MKSKIVFAEARDALHRALVTRKILVFDSAGVASNADRKNAFSCAIAKHMAKSLGAETVDKKEKGQTAGAGFETVVSEFVATTFPRLQNLRPGNWTVMRLGNKSKVKTANFAQYEHLFDLAEAVRDNPKLQAALGNDYLVSPDVIVSRGLCEDAESTNWGISSTILFARKLISARVTEDGTYSMHQYRRSGLCAATAPRTAERKR